MARTMTKAETEAGRVAAVRKELKALGATFSKRAVGDYMGTVNGTVCVHYHAMDMATGMNTGALTVSMGRVDASYSFLQKQWAVQGTDRMYANYYASTTVTDMIRMIAKAAEDVKSVPAPAVTAPAPAAEKAEELDAPSAMTDEEYEMCIIRSRVNWLRRVHGDIVRMDSADIMACWNRFALPADPTDEDFERTASDWNSIDRIKRVYIDCSKAFVDNDTSALRSMLADEETVSPAAQNAVPASVTDEEEVRRVAKALLTEALRGCNGFRGVKITDAEREETGYRVHADFTADGKPYHATVRMHMPDVGWFAAVRVPAGRAGYVTTCTADARNPETVTAWQFRLAGGSPFGCSGMFTDALDAAAELPTIPRLSDRWFTRLREGASSMAQTREQNMRTLETLERARAA